MKLSHFILTWNTCDPFLFFRAYHQNQSMVVSVTIASILCYCAILLFFNKCHWMFKMLYVILSILPYCFFDIATLRGFHTRVWQTIKKTLTSLLTCKANKTTYHSLTSSTVKSTCIAIKHSRRYNITIIVYNFVLYYNVIDYTCKITFFFAVQFWNSLSISM